MPIMIKSYETHGLLNMLNCFLSNKCFVMCDILYCNAQQQTHNDNSKVKATRCFATAEKTAIRLCD